MQPSLSLSEKSRLVEYSFHSGPSSAIISNDGFRKKKNRWKPTERMMEHKSLDSTSSFKSKLAP